jgi:hypothetical protein
VHAPGEAVRVSLRAEIRHVSPGTLDPAECLVKGLEVADSDAIRAKRYRMHQQGDHSECKTGRCQVLTVVPDGAGAPAPSGDVAELLAAVEEEFPPSDRLSRALARRLAGLSDGRGPAAVQALRALGELVAAQRDGPGRLGV